MKHNVIYIKYIDSAVYNQEDRIDRDYKPIEFEAVGFLLKEDEVAVVLAREVRHDTEHNARAVLVIPKVAILERKVLEK